MVVVDDRTGLVDELRHLAGDGLRAVAEYDADGYDVFFVREDVESRLDGMSEELHDDLILQGIGRDRLEDLFDAGPLHCSMHRFDDLTAFHFVADPYSGLFVSLDADADVPVATFVERCKEPLP